MWGPCLSMPLLFRGRQGAIAGRKEADAARETLAASLGRANARIAQLTSQNSQLTRYGSAGACLARLAAARSIVLGSLSTCYLLFNSICVENQRMRSFK